MSDKPTREMILNEPAGRQMDAWVLEYVMGYRKIECPRTVWFSMDRWRELSDTVFFKNITGSMFIADKNGYGVFRTSQDIAAAWQVMEKLLSGDFGRHFYIELSNKTTTGTGWNCLIYDVGYAEADTAPLAICRAGLLAVLEGER